MADSLDPDAISEHAFRRQVRGYDPQEVRAFLGEVAGTVRELTSKYQAAHERLLELGNRDLSAEFDRISEDVARILQDAREAAEGMRKRAAGDAESLVEEAQTTAVNLRTDAWMAAEKLLQDSGNEADAIVQAAGRDSLAILGEAERDAHRRQAAVRRESGETVRAAKLEAERLLADARGRSDELIQEADRRVQDAEERAAAIEERRTEMLAELENARQTIGNLEAEIEKRREALAGPSPEEVESSTVKLLTAPEREAAEGEESSAWGEDDEVVRIVRAPKRIVDLPAEPVDAEAMAAEVARLRSPLDEPEEDLELVAVEEPEVAETLEPPRPAAVTEATEPAPAPTSEIDDLFARLREGGATAPEGAEEATVAAEEAGPGQAGGAESEGPKTAPTGIDEPFDRRDRALLPVTNRALRAVKRQLTEAQNIALEELRVESGNWEPAPAALGERLVEPLGVLLREGYGAGWSVYGESEGPEPPVDDARQGDVGELSAAFAENLTSGVGEALDESRREGQGPRQLAAVLSRVYRSWRTDEAERRVHDMASGAFHRGLMEGMAAAGISEKRWVVAGRGCATCRGAAEAGAVPVGAAFEDDLTGPPAHPNCRCTLTAG